MVISELYAIYRKYVTHASHSYNIVIYIPDIFSCICHSGSFLVMLFLHLNTHSGNSPGVHREPKNPT